MPPSSAWRAPIPISRRRSRRPSTAWRRPTANPVATARATPLGTLFDLGIQEAHFRAATWDLGSGKGLSLVTFEAAGLTTQNLFDSFVAAASINSKVHDPTLTDPTIGGEQGHRLDYLNGDSSFQRILVWPGDRDGHVRVLLAADLLDVEIAAAAAAFH